MVITNPQILINVISRRVKQLIAGHRPLVEVDSVHMGFCDIALTEVIKRKLSYELITAPAPAAVPPDRSRICSENSEKTGRLIRR